MFAALEAANGHRWLTAFLSPTGNGKMTNIEMLEETLFRGRSAASLTCFWTGDSRFVADLIARAAPAGMFASLYLTEGTGADRGGAPDAVFQERLAGPLIGAQDFPRLADVVSFASMTPDPHAVVSLFAQQHGAAKTRLGDRPALDELTSRIAPSRLDLVVLDGESMVAGEITKRLLGAASFIVSGTRSTFGGAAAFAALYASNAYDLAASDDAHEAEWAFFVRRAPDLPIHFFTIVLNGEPFIRYHEKMMRSLPFRWHWHIVEGVADLVGDTGWSVPLGGYIANDVHRDGLSVDGTRDYIDDLARELPSNVSVYRKGDGSFWHGKLEMVNAPLVAIAEECLLWQIDADELWTAAQVLAVRDAFVAEPDRTAAAFWCRYYVGPDRGIATRYNYAEDPHQEWLRVWRFDPDMRWRLHEPPSLRGSDALGDYDVGRRHPFTHAEMETRGAVFDHLAYATEAQVGFKETYYGHRNAVARWRLLQQSPRRSGRLSDYFEWVTDDTLFDTVERLGWSPLARQDEATGRWIFADGTAPASASRMSAKHDPLVVVDGIFFQLSNSGIARLWRNLLAEWSRSGFGANVVVLDRGGTAPRIEGIRYQSIELHSWSTLNADARYLQEVCDRLGADLFVSTYYTTPTVTPTIFMGYDMIPETLSVDLDDVWWRQKRRAIQYGSGHIVISESSARELTRFFPFVDREKVLVAHCSVDACFKPCTPGEIKAFRKRHGIDREFVMIVGERVGWKGYKNGVVVFAGLAQIPRDRRPLLVCVGGAAEMEPAGRMLLEPDDFVLVKLDDDDLRCCYASALAYVCPSLLEGFGLPIAEAMTVGTPTLVCRNSSIPEVAGDAGVYFDANDPVSLAAAIEEVRDEAARSGIIKAGREQAATFDQARAGQAIAEYCNATFRRLGGKNRSPHEGALADMLDEAEDNSLAQARLRNAEARIFEAKAELATAARSLHATLDQSAGDDGGHIAVAQHAIARGFASLRDLNRSSAIGDAAVLPTSSPDGVIVIEAKGLSDVEGPYPTNKIFRKFCWQVAPVASVTFEIPEAMDFWLQVEFGNRELDQRIGLFIDHTQLCAFSPAETGGQHVWRMRAPVSLKAGRTTVSLTAVASTSTASDHRDMYIAVYAIRLNARQASAADRPEVVDLHTTSLETGSQTAAMIEIPALLTEASGLSPREGPYPDWGIRHSFRWQTEETSRHVFSLDRPSDALLQLHFSNVEAGQTVTLSLNGTPLTTFTPRETGWDREWQLRVPVYLEAGSNTVSLNCTMYHSENESGRRLYVGIYGVRLLFGSDAPAVPLVALAPADDQRAPSSDACCPTPSTNTRNAATF